MTTMAENLKAEPHGLSGSCIYGKANGDTRTSRLVEVKSQNDQLSPHQLRWLNTLQSASMQADVLRVHNLG